MKPSAGQKTAGAVILALLGTLLAVHNPTEGYVADHWEQGGVGTYEWGSGREGCTPQLQAELQVIDSDTSLNGIDQLNHPRRRAIYRQCMSYKAPTPSHIEHSFLTWESRGALRQEVASVKSVLAAASFIFLWGLVFLYALRPKETDV